jgi:hypothetical protein
VLSVALHGCDSFARALLLHPVQIHLYDGGQPFNTRQQAWLQAYLSSGQTWSGSSPIVNGAVRPTPKIMVVFDRMVRSADFWCMAALINPVAACLCVRK